MQVKELAGSKRLGLIYTAGSAGALLQVGGGYWDGAWHILQRPETFWSPPHIILYSGVGIVAVVALLGILLGLRNVAHSNLFYGLRIVFLGSSLQIFAGWFDSWWHSVFGVDALLSPPHFLLVIGMVLISLGMVKGVAVLIKADFSKLARFSATLSFAALWMASNSLVFMFTLPFSRGVRIDLNPDPILAAAVATVLLPIIAPIILLAAYRIAAIPATFVAGIYMSANALSSIVANPSIQWALPFYVLNIMLAVAFDALRMRLGDRGLFVVVGSLLMAPFFYTLCFPSTVPIYRQALSLPPTTQLLSHLYAVYSWTIMPALLAGLLGSFLAIKINQTPARLTHGGMARGAA